MLTVNEQILKTQLEELQAKMEEMTIYTSVLRDAVMQASANNPTSCTEQFYCSDQYEMYVPFQAYNYSCHVDVYEDIGNGNFRQITPVITFNGSSIRVRFDHETSGFIVCTNDGPGEAQMHVPNSPMYVNTGTPLVEEPPLLQMSISDDDINNLAETPDGIEIIPPVGVDLNDSEMTNENNFTKAMKGITTWP